MAAINKLTALRVQREKQAGVLIDGGGLRLVIRATGSKAWVFRYTLDGKTREMGLGSYPQTSLEQARNLATEQRALVKTKIDPLHKREDDEKLRLVAQTKQAALSMSFQDCAERCMEAKRAGWRNEKHAAQWASTLRTYVYPVFGAVPVNEVSTDLVLAALTPIWSSKNETASRVRQRIETVLSWAGAMRLRNANEINPAQWRGHLDALLAKPSDVQPVDSHHAAVSFSAVPAIMRDLRTHHGQAARAMAFLILTAARTGEVIGATWDEIDWARRLWIIPANRMKAKKEHRVPLTERAVQILADQPRVVGNDHIFHGQSRRRVGLSNMAMLMLLKTAKSEGGLGYPGATVHGFRSAFRDWAGETTGHGREVIEQALAHQLKDKAEAAYRRGDLLAKRLALMEDWASFVLAGQAQVMPIGGLAKSA
jgi:integrase